MNKAVPKNDDKTRVIARVALELFSQKGYAGTSMLDIARAAGLGKSTLYGYFATKEDLFQAATHLWTQAKITRLREYTASVEDPLAQLNGLAAYFEDEIIEKNRDMVRMFIEFLQQTLIQGGVLYNRSGFLMEEMLGAQKVFEDILLEGVARGVFRPQIAPMASKLAVNLLSFLDGLIFRRLVFDNQINAREHIALYIDQLTANWLVPAPAGAKT